MNGAPGAIAAVGASRRGLLLGIGASAAGLLVGVAPVGARAARAFVPNAFVHLQPDGTLTIACHRSEMGQGVRSALPHLIAREMGAGLDRVQIVQADADPRYGSQNTDGSSSVRRGLEALRLAGAVARTMLVEAAADRLGVRPQQLVAADHEVLDPATGARVGFGALADEAASLDPPHPDHVELRAPEDLPDPPLDLPPNVDAAAFATGRAVFGADVRLPGMLTAVIARPPAVGGTPAGIDDAGALATPGVRHVLRLPDAPPHAGFAPLGGVAVVADHTWAALEGRRRLKITWRPGENGDYDTATYDAQRQEAVDRPGEVVRQTGDVDAALGSAATIVQAEYRVPHLAHAPMEPPAAVARRTARGCEVWACTQAPVQARREIATLLDVPEEDVVVHVTFLGGGFGRKSKPDFVLEAVWLADRIGAPVRVQWTRTDEIQHGYYHATATQRLWAGLSADGRVGSWRHRISAPSISATFRPDVPRIQPGELGQGVLDQPLDVEHVRVEAVDAPARVRIGWMRSVHNINHAFAINSFTAEIAAAAGRPHLEVLREIVGPPRRLTAKGQGVARIPNYGIDLDEQPLDTARWHRAIDRVVALSGLESPRPGLGLAAHYSFGTYVAAVVAVSRDPKGRPAVDRVFLAADPGQIVHRDRVLAQLEGAVAFGLSLALYGRVSMARGATEQTNFRDYRLLRLPQMPPVDIALITEGEPHGGIGEPGVPPIAPALCNAWASLTQERCRVLPLLEGR